MVGFGSHRIGSNTNYFGFGGLRGPHFKISKPGILVLLSEWTTIIENIIVRT